VIQLQPLLTNDAGAETPVGNDTDVTIGPGALPVPTFATVTGKLLATPATNAGLGWPSVVVISGMPFTGAVVTGVAALLPVFTSLLTGLVVALMVGVVPMVAALGVTGTLKLLDAPLLIGPELVQPTIVTVVLQLQPLLTNDAGAVKPVGKVMVVVIWPIDGADPMLLTVTGILLVAPAVRVGVGWPMAVVKSAAPTTGLVICVGLAVLLAVTASLATGAVLALNIGFVPKILALGVTGTSKVELPAIGTLLGLLQATTLPVVVQLQPLLVKVAGAVTPAGNETVVLIGPDAKALPLLATVTGKALDTPTVKPVAGWPMLVVKSGTPKIGMLGLQDPVELVEVTTNVLAPTEPVPLKVIGITIDVWPLVIRVV
jgi:hypothetical protein